MVISANSLYLNRGNICTMWDPGRMKYVFRGKRDPVISLGCFSVLHDFMCHSFPPVCPYVRPPQRVIVSEGDRDNIHILVLPLLVFIEFSEIRWSSGLNRVVGGKKRLRYSY